LKVFNVSPTTTLKRAELKIEIQVFAVSRTRIALLPNTIYDSAASVM
jgi:hypothetical protein